MNPDPRLSTQPRLWMALLYFNSAAYSATLAADPGSVWPQWVNWTACGVYLLATALQLGARLFRIREWAK